MSLRQLVTVCSGCACLSPRQHGLNFQIYLGGRHQTILHSQVFSFSYHLVLEERKTIWEVAEIEPGSSFSASDYSNP